MFNHKAQFFANRIRGPRCAANSPESASIRPSSA